MKIISTIILALSICFGLSAEPEKKDKKGGSEGRPSREEMLKKFDKDGDGKLSEDEHYNSIVEWGRNVAKYGDKIKLPKNLAPHCFERDKI